MFINISELISTPLKTETFKVPVDMPTYEWQGEHFPFRKKGMLLLEGDWYGSLGIRFDRCLKVVLVPFHIELDETIDLSSERQEDLADDSYVEENSIDTDALINHEILIHFPMKVLCREDCRGICLKCGKNLNHGECGCDRVSPDPRMAAIQDIFKNFKEV